jgi:hypothetical protein
MSETQTTAEPTGGRGWAWLGGRDGFLHRHDGGFRAAAERAEDELRELEVLSLLALLIQKYKY